MVQRLHNKGNMQVCAPAGPGRCARIACNKKINDYSAAAIGYCNDVSITHTA